MEQIMFSMWNDVPIRFPTLACGGNEDFSALSGPYPEHRRKLHYQEHSEISTRARTGRGDGGRGGKKNQVAQIVFFF